MKDLATNIAQWRLRSQRIVGRPCVTPQELVRWFGAMQAQDYAAARWAIGLRVPGISEADVERAIDQKQLVRTWPMRGTIHFVPAEDAHWMLELMAPRVMSKFKGIHRQVGVDQAYLDHGMQILAKVMQGGKLMTRKDVLQALVQAGLDTGEQRGYHLLVYAAHKGLIAMTSLEGRQPTLVWFDDWLPKSQRKTMSREEALAEMARRYVRSHGPVTVYDFAWWTGLTIKDARDAFASVACTIQQLPQDESYWMAKDLDTGTLVEQTVTLVPPFDETIVALKDRSAVVSSQAMRRVVPYTNGVFSPVVLVNGQFAGLWKRTVKKDGVTMDISLLRPLPKRQKMLLHQQAEGYAAFLGVPLLAVSYEQM